MTILNPYILGATRTVEATEVLYARQKFITVAKAFKIQAIDIVHINFKGKSHTVLDRDLAAF